MYSIECSECSGGGKILTHVKASCNSCGGSGYFMESLCRAGCDHGVVLDMQYVDCRKCQGTGKTTSSSGFAMM